MCHFHRRCWLRTEFFQSNRLSFGLGSCLADCIDLEQDFWRILASIRFRTGPCFTKINKIFWIENNFSIRVFRFKYTSLPSAVMMILIHFYLGSSGCSFIFVLSCKAVCAEHCLVSKNILICRKAWLTKMFFPIQTCCEDVDVSLTQFPYNSGIG